MRRFAPAVLIALMLVAVFRGALTESAMKAQDRPIWPMFRNNAQHARQCPYDTSRNNGTLTWKYETGDLINSAPAIAADGTIYAGSEDHYLHARGNPSFIITACADAGGSIAPSDTVTVNYGTSKTFAGRYEI